MKIKNQYCCVLRRIHPKQSFRVIFLLLAYTTISCFIHNASSQTPSGGIRLVGPALTPVGQEFDVSARLTNTQDVNWYDIDIRYPEAVDFVKVSGADGNPKPTDHTELFQSGLKSKHFTHGLTDDNTYSAGLIFTVTFVAEESGNHEFEVVGALFQGGGNSGFANVNPRNISVNVKEVGGSIAFHRPSATTRTNVPSSVEIRLVNRKGLHHYSITIDPSENLGSLSVAYASDDTDPVLINNHTAGAPITIRATLTDGGTDGLYAQDSAVAALMFTPTAAGEATLEITEAKLYISDTDTIGVGATLPSTNPLTFEMTEAPPTITTPITGTGPKVVFTLFEPGIKRGPFDIDIGFASENLIRSQINADAGTGIQRGVIGLEPTDIIVGGDAGAFLTSKLWGSVGDNGAIARITPTRTGTVEIRVPAGAVTEFGTGLPNVESEIFIVNVVLSNPPWNVNKDGNVDQTDVDLVEAAIGQRLVDISAGNGQYKSGIENERTDVNGDMYVTQADVQMVKDNLDDNGVQGNSERSTEKERGFQPRSVATPPPDASVWMPDENLRKYVRRQLNITDDKDLTQARMTEPTSLAFRSEEITDITGLEYATNLTALVFRKTQISDLEPLKRLTSLRSLKLVDNDISNVTPLGNLTNLTFLNISGNNVSDITALGNLTKLTDLWATDNNISVISALAGLTKLRKLRLRDNSILDTSPIYRLTQGVLRSVDISVSEYPPWDVNEDGSVDATDSALVTAALGQSGNAIVNARTDVNGDETVDNADLTLVTGNLDANGGAPSTAILSRLLDRETLESLDREALEGYLNTLRAESDGSLKYRRAIDLLESLLVAIRPRETLLLANYPNPFNPETWMPYHLANASDVQITIYDVHGQVIRRLDLGHQTAGHYTIQSRAAYWDGTNDFGERVASGIYFYQLQANDVSALRKMVILK